MGLDLVDGYAPCGGHVGEAIDVLVHDKLIGLVTVDDGDAVQVPQPVGPIVQ